MIDVLVPVLARPANALPLVESLRASIDVEAEIIFLCSPGDEEEIAACQATGERVIVVDWPAKKFDYARKMNEGYRSSSNPWIFLGADDISFERGWFEEAMHAFQENTCVISTNDLSNKQVMRGEFGTHCLVLRSYADDPGASCDGPGLLVHEGYDHNFVDRELCHLAQHRGVFVYAPRSRVRHRHPTRGTAPDDSTYKKALAGFFRDQHYFLKRSHLWGRTGLSDAEKRRAFQLTQ